MRIFLFLYFVSSLALFAGGNDTSADLSQDNEKKASQEEQTVVERVQVLGSPENAAKTPGSAHYISSQELKEKGNDDIHRILRDVPGINIQEEDGLGLRPNIGMRGTGVERSQKITVMEDGVLIAPAPYTAPAAYYFPTAGRMESVEVLKGSSSVKQGPYTNGGSLNLISSSIPTEFKAQLDLSAGSHGTFRGKASVGDTRERFGWVIEGYTLESDGFKDLDNGDNTGVSLDDFMGKFRFNSSASANVYQSVELKLGVTNQFGEETYLGITEADFRDTPYRRYAASAEDTMDTEHEQVQIRYFVKPNSAFDVTTTIYNNDYFRNWHKLGSLKNGGSSFSPGSVLANPGDYADELAILRGEQDSDAGALVVRNNRRNYFSRGIQSVLHWGSENGRHEIEAGVRYHQDEEDRFQDDDFYTMTDGNMVLDHSGAPGSQSNRVSEATATSFFIQDLISVGNWTFKPGLRYEQIDYTRSDYSKTDPTRSEGPTRIRENDVDVFLPGLGINYDISTGNRAFLGIHKGFSPPGAGKNELTEEERSYNYEMGYRHFNGPLKGEVIGFFNDYSNLLGADTGSGGGQGTGELFNGGEVDVKGIEAALSYTFNAKAETNFPFSVNYTYTSSEFKSNFETSFADWSPEVQVGDELPYIPENQYSIDMGIARKTWRALLSTSYVSEMRTTAGQGAIASDERIEDHTVFDLNLSYNFRQYRFFAHIRNLTDETYIVARRPYGVRPGLERSVMMGFSANF